MTALQNTHLPDGWRALENSSTEYLVQAHKSYDGEPDVIISVQIRDRSFYVITNAESRTSGPNIKESAPLANQDQAIDYLLAEAIKWDDRMAKFS